MKFYSPIEDFIEEIESDYQIILESRKRSLQDISNYSRQKINDDQTAKLIFICTHNSRRSHFAQIWAATAINYFGLKNIEPFSGGTEATAFNPNAVAAIKRAGFKVGNSGGENPHYKVYFSDDVEPITCFSKTFDDSSNPEREFAAIMTCSDADENCPFVPGAEFRRSVTYEDPKVADGTNQETQIYDERCRQIATEMFYLISEI